MKEEPVTDALLRQLLLGKVTDEERQRIESLFLIDAEMKERMFAAEQELLDDYLEGTLTREDRDLFLLHYGQTPEQQSKLRIAESIKEWAAAEAKPPQTVPVKVSSSGAVGARWWLKPSLVIPIALAAIILIVVAAVWLSRQQHQAIEQEVAQLNAPESLREVPPQMVSLNLSPVAVRSAEQQPEIKTRADIRIVELRLPWIQKEQYSTYHAVLRQAESDKSFMFPHIQVDSVGVIRLRVPAHILMRGLYKIELSGIAADGNLGPTEEYSFAVVE
jgi:hypothetical protein